MSTTYSIRDSFELFIFDLDGTLVDSHHQIESAMNEARVAMGYGNSPAGQIFQKLGLPVNELFADLKLSLSLQSELISTFRSFLLQKIKLNNECFPEAVELMRLIRSSGIKTAIATSKQTSMAEEVIRNSLLNGEIDHVQGTDGFAPKPNPEVINKCLEIFPGRRAIMIGDRIEDILAASSAGIPSIGLAQSAHTLIDLKKVGASFVFSNISDFYREIRN